MDVSNQAGASEGGKGQVEGETREAADAREDAALDKIFGSDDGEAPAPSVSPVDALREAEATDTPDGQEASTEAQEAPEDNKQPVEDDVFRLAAARLRRDGFTTADIAMLDPDRVIELGTARAKVQDDYDSTYAELTTLRETPPEERPGSKNDAEAPPENAGLMEQARAIADELALDDDGAERLAKLVQASNEPLRAQLAEQQAAMQRMSERSLKSEAEVARQGLQEQFPQLQDATSPEYARVLGRMNSLQRSGEYTSAAELMGDAVLIEFRKDIAADAAKNQAKIRKARANGQTVNPRVESGKTQERAVSLKPSELEDAVLELLDQGTEESLAQAHTLARNNR